MKKLLIALAVAACFLAACESKTTLSSKSDGIAAILARNKQTAINSATAFIKRDANAIYKDYAPVFVEYGNGEGKPDNNMDTLKASLKTMYANFPELKVSNIKAIAEDNMVIITAIWSGTTPKKAKRPQSSFKYPDADIYTFNAAGKIIAHKSVQSEVTAMYQLGMLLPAKK